LVTADKEFSKILELDLFLIEMWNIGQQRLCKFQSLKQILGFSYQWLLP
jgi:hypothetical protein